MAQEEVTTHFGIHRNKQIAECVIRAEGKKTPYLWLLFHDVTRPIFFAGSFNFRTVGKVKDARKSGFIRGVKIFRFICLTSCYSRAEMLLSNFCLIGSIVFFLEKFGEQIILGAVPLSRESFF
jgi:hypothetical protein